MPASSRLLLKMEQIARFRVAGAKDVAIARQLNLTNSGLQRILRTIDYLEIQQNVLGCQLDKMDVVLNENVGLMRKTFDTAVPAALRFMVEQVKQKRDLRAAMKAAENILDRDPEGRYVKASDRGKISTQPTEAGTRLSEKFFEDVRLRADKAALEEAKPSSELVQ